MQINWLSDAVADLGGEPEQVAEPQLPASKGDSAQTRLLTEDRDAARAFVEKWKPRLDGVSNARHRSLLRVILGETLEHQRFFEQALAGRTDLLGRRADGAGTGGGVLGTRWIEQ